MAAAGPSQVLSCINCVQPFNATLASGLASLAEDCASLSTLTATSYATATSNLTATPGNSTASSPTLAPTCLAACSLASGAERTCLDYACACPTVLAAGSVCSQCYASINATEASLWGQDIALCRTWSATALANNTVPSTCTAVCNSVASVTTCANLDCSCPAILAAGPACSQCIGSFNITQSSIGQAITRCLSWSATFQKPTATSTKSSSGPAVTVQVTVVTQTPSVGSRFVTVQWMYLVNLGILAGLFSIFL